jgi:exopolysaccharide biosynthesis polyprenyl glycosylphosphotransferase
MLFAAWILSLALFDLYRQKSLVNFYELANRLILAVGAALVASIVLFYLFGTVFHLTPRTNLFIFSAIFALLDYFLRAVWRKGAAARPSPAILIGNSKSMAELKAFLDEYPHAGYRTAEWFREFGEEEIRALPTRIKETGAHAIVVESRLARDPRAVREIYRILPLGAAVFNFSDFYELMFERVPLEELEESWFIEHVVSRRPFYDGTKRVVDVLLSLFLLVALSPIALVIAVFVPLASRGPAIFEQKRMGHNGREFSLYKFRTMNTWNGGADGTPAWTVEDDSRVTGLGKILRATHLDEIPQLWNILRGDISFTGPRPESVKLALEFAAFPYYEIRHVVQPGLTGWAQINYRPSASLEEARAKLAYDIYYIKNRSFLLDLAILMKTLKYLFAKAE